MPESITTTRLELIAAIVAMAGVIGYLLQTLFKGNQEEKKQITTAYLLHVENATLAMTKSADSISDLAAAVNNNSRVIQRHCETTQVEHAAVLSVLGLDPDRSRKDAEKGGRRHSDKQEKTDEQ